MYINNTIPVWMNQRNSQNAIQTIWAVAVFGIWEILCKGYLDLVIEIWGVVFCEFECGCIEVERAKIKIAQLLRVRVRVREREK